MFVHFTASLSSSEVKSMTAWVRLVLLLHKMIMHMVLSHLC